LIEKVCEPSAALFGLTRAPINVAELNIDCLKTRVELVCDGFETGVELFFHSLEACGKELFQIAQPVVLHFHQLVCRWLSQLAAQMLMRKLAEAMMVLMGFRPSSLI
jgi:hypothetical protein